jgi:hypothetical protein
MFTTACAQSFEGIIRYTIICDYEDSVKQKKGLAERALAESGASHFFPERCLPGSGTKN